MGWAFLRSQSRWCTTIELHVHKIGLRYDMNFRASCHNQISSKDVMKFYWDPHYKHTLKVLLGLIFAGNKRQEDWSYRWIKVVSRVPIQITIGMFPLQTVSLTLDDKTTRTLVSVIIVVRKCGAMTTKCLHEILMKGLIELIFLEVQFS